MGLVIAVAGPWWKEEVGMVIDRLISGVFPKKGGSP